MKLRETTIHGHPGWVIDHGIRDGKRKRQFFRDKDSADRAFRAAQRSSLDVGRRWTEFPATEKAKAVAILREIRACRSPGSVATTLNRIATLFSFAVRQGWVGANVCDRIDRPHLDVARPEVLSVEEATLVMEHTATHMPGFLPWLTLALFAGIRPEEADRLEWPSVDLERGIVTLDAEGSKVRSRRLVHLKANAVEWLRLGGDLPLSKPVRVRYQRLLRKLLGWPVWKKDVLRHSAASYWLASDPDAPRIALELGNSPSILMTHYRSLVTDERANAFWAILPSKEVKKKINLQKN